MRQHKIPWFLAGEPTAGIGGRSTEWLIAVSFALTSFVQPVGNEHLAGCMRDTERQPAEFRYILRRHTAGPEHRQFIIHDLDRVAEIRAHQVGDADGLRITDMYRCTMNLWQACGDFHRA